MVAALDRVCTVFRRAGIFARRVCFGCPARPVHLSRSRPLKRLKCCNACLFLVGCQWLTAFRGRFISRFTLKRWSGRFTRFTHCVHCKHFMHFIPL